MTTDISAKHPGRVLALDLGEKRIGVALSDATRTIAAAIGVVNRKSRAEDMAYYAQLIAERGITLIVVGLPINLSGQEGTRAAWTRDYAADMAARLPVPVVFWDESLTTVQAEAALRAQGRRGKKLRQRVDAVAAALILQNYLESQREAGDGR